MKKAECYIVPILISATKTAENLSAAALTRGIENPVPGTCREYKKFEWQDYCLVFIGIALIVFSIRMKVMGA